MQSAFRGPHGVDHRPYPVPPAPEEYLQHYRSVHVPLVRQLPGLLDLEITERPPVDSAFGRPLLLVALLKFPDNATMKAALVSAEAAVAMADVASFAGGNPIQIIRCTTSGSAVPGSSELDG